MQKLNQQHISELNKSLREIQDSFDDAMGKLGSKTKALKFVIDKFKDKNNRICYKISETERLAIIISSFQIYEDNFCVDLRFLSKFSHPSFRPGEVGYDEIKTISKFTKKTDYWEWRNFSECYYDDSGFEAIEKEENIRLNQLDIEAVIGKRDKIAKEYTDFRKNGYSIDSGGTTMSKDFSMTYFVWGKASDTYLTDIYNHILADFRTDNDRETRFVIDKGDREIVIFLDESHGDISISFQNTTFQEAKEYYQKVEKRIVEIKEIIALRSKVGKIIKNTQGSLFGVLGSWGENLFSSKKEKFPKSQVFHDMKKVFEEMREKGEKRESEIMLIFLDDIMDDIQNNSLEKHEAHYIVEKIGNNDSIVVSEYYYYKLKDLLVKGEDKEKIESIIDIYRKLYIYFDKDRKKIRDLIIQISKEYILGRNSSSIDRNILNDFSKIISGNNISNSYEFYERLYISFKDIDIDQLSNKKPLIDIEQLSDENLFIDLEKYNLFDKQLLIDLEKYSLFSKLIWKNKNPIDFVMSILVPMIILKIEEDISSTTRDIDISISKLKSRLNIPKCEFYDTLFKSLTETEEQFILGNISENIVDIIIDKYKDRDFLVRLSILSRCIGLWKTLDIDSKEKFVKKIISKTILEQVSNQLISNKINTYTEKYIISQFEIYKNYMTDEYVDYYIKKSTRSGPVEYNSTI